MKMDGQKYMNLVESINKANDDLNLGIGICKAEPVKSRFELFVPTRSDLKPMKVPNQANSADAKKPRG
jgi:hypothetical protein